MGVSETLLWLGGALFWVGGDEWGWVGWVGVGALIANALKVTQNLVDFNETRPCKFWFNKFGYESFDDLDVKLLLNEFNSFLVSVAILYPLKTPGRKFNIHKTFRRRPDVLEVFWTFYCKSHFISCDEPEPILLIFAKTRLGTAYKMEFQLSRAKSCSTGEADVSHRLAWLGRCL